MADNKEDKNFRPASFSCEKPIYININSNHWKYSLFDVEIFTYYTKNINKMRIRLWI